MSERIVGWSLVAVVTCIVVICITMTLVIKPITPEQEEAITAKQNVKTAEKVQAGMFYFQDKRSGLCYAYYWGGAQSGGPALTLVPRDKVQEFLVNP
jgi:hypothetical protein